MMTNYDIWLEKRRQELETKQKELDEMTPLLAAVAIDDHDTKYDRCSLIEEFDEPVKRCADYCCNVACIGCIKEWLAEEVVE